MSLRPNGAIFGELIRVAPTSAKGVAALSLYVEEVHRHPLGLWRLN